MASITITKTQQIIAKSDVNDIVFSECTKVGFALDVKAFNLIEEVAFQKRIHICLHRMGAGVPLRFSRSKMSRIMTVE